MALQNKCGYQHFGQVCNSGAAILCLIRDQSLAKAKNECLYRMEWKQLIGFGKLFHDWVCQVLLKMHQSIPAFTDFSKLPPCQWKVLNFEAFGWRLMV